jgi:hypothetical protein
MSSSSADSCSACASDMSRRSSWSPADLYLPAGSANHWDQQALGAGACQGGEASVSKTQRIWLQSVMCHQKCHKHGRQAADASPLRLVLHTVA